jgi:hypothetical protein
MEKNLKTSTKTQQQPIKKQGGATDTTVKTGEFAFGNENYRLMLIGLVFIVVGFLLMIGGGSDDPKVFNPEIFSFRRLTLSPILILAGYVIEIFAIMKKPKN